MKQSDALKVTEGCGGHRHLTHVHETSPVSVQANHHLRPGLAARRPPCQRHSCGQCSCMPHVSHTQEVLLALARALAVLVEFSREETCGTHDSGVRISQSFEH